eukprot:CAMPEP_0118673914 /NCGR_PEP_ID=MMETSP0800-20121206/598_1 /TAXON_ID=210618 ORGANISM="Striatella unipunctata, Strain CCMP2910" /NCGR_SAMPLE_ID=MMETSP0800 /ASSEMBLY_ACC=CAM_ASM_000638 /LENGTH=80 /DNA_ID=CAMNT_0006569053 /DNA_START=86 /DNA_END=328 /DNA_ORIENTATION=-
MDESHHSRSSAKSTMRQSRKSSITVTDIKKMMPTGTDVADFFENHLTSLGEEKSSNSVQMKNQYNKWMSNNLRSYRCPFE